MGPAVSRPCYRLAEDHETPVPVAFRVSRAGFVGMPTHVVQSLRRADARAPVDPAIYMAGNAPALDRRV